MMRTSPDVRVEEPELDAHARINRAHDVAEKKARPFQDADQQWIEPGVVARDLRSDLLNARRNLFL